ncbi:hypothetical protein, partial [Thalassobaculum salexigens]|uniref:hypothetical protein n=1 Tax=Thalassobaculum salexigens TaxID=455360 RepID=UPI00248F22F4
KQLIADLGIEPDRTWATPMPFNTLFWRVIAIDGDRYLNLYIPLLGTQETVTAYTHSRGGPLLACIEDLPKAAELAAFSKGFFKVWEADGRILVSDLRMGVTPNYVFQFAVAERDGDALSEIVPVRLSTERGAADRDIDWLWTGILGERAVRPAEEDDLYTGESAVRVAGPMAPRPSACSPG